MSVESDEKCIHNLVGQLEEKKHLLAEMVEIYKI
jgi:hypothetical protein